MKRRKLISLVSACSVLTATVPFFATSCKKDINSLAAYSTVTSNIPEITMVETIAETETVEFTCSFLNSSLHPVTDKVKWVYTVERPQKEEQGLVNISFKSNNNTLTMDVQLTHTPTKPLDNILIYKVTVKAYSATTSLYEDAVGKEELLIHIVPKTKNFIIRNNKQIEIEENIDPNKFCWSLKKTPSEKWVPDKIVLPLKDKTEKTEEEILYSERAQLTGISIQSCALPAEPDNVIGNLFLSQCEYLNFVNIYGLLDKPIASIGNEFLTGCIRLQSIDLSPLNKVVNIGYDFMRGCSKLEFIEMYQFGEQFAYFDLETVGDNFLLDCESITEVDFSYFNKIYWMGNNFLRNCKSMKRLKFWDYDPDESITKVTEIEESFLADCWSLTELENFDTLRDVEIINNWFMGGCVKLPYLDMSSLKALESVGGYFLSDCTKLEYLTLPSGSESSLSIIGSHFLNDCSSLTIVDLSGLIHASEFGDWFLNNCLSLTILYLPVTDGDVPWLASESVEIYDAWGKNIAYYNFDQFIIHCGSKLDAYKGANNWSIMSNFMIE